MRIFVKMVISLLWLCFPYCWARIEPIELPRDLKENLEICSSSANLSHYSAEVVFWTAVQQYVTRFVEQRPSMSQDEMLFFSSTVQTAMAGIQQYYSSGSRFKRQAQVQPRIRKEIRSMSIEERTRYFNALNRLKNDRRLTPNVYDVLASMHSGENIARAHFGPAFPGWHRLYLYLVETFLRLHDPDVTIPFWASVLDNDMTDPTQSVVFSDGFFGPGVGEPTTGPFRGWRQVSPATIFQRNVGSGGTLYTHDGIQNILQRTRNRQILLPTADPEANFELQHGGPHSYVGGTMNNLQRAAYDPIFFSHHAFVDQIWERFRYGSRNAGIDTETDYPFDANNSRFRPQHNPDNITGFFPNNEVNIDFIQRTGYSNAFYQLVLYEEVPSCPNCNGSPYLFCNNNLLPPRCVSRTVREQRLTGPNYVDELPGLSLNGEPISRRMQSQMAFRSEIRNSTEACPRRQIINDVDIKFPRFKETPHTLSNWVYVPVKIISQRPDDYEGFEKYTLKHGMTGHFGGHQKAFSHSTRRTLERDCDRDEDAVSKTKIVSYGLNYNGYAEEYAVVDNRLGVSESTGYIPVRRPYDGSASLVVVAAFDACGRVCKPYSNNDVTGRMVHNKLFSGGLKVTTDLPLQFGDTYAEATLNVWNIPSQDFCPTLVNNQIPVTFFCDDSDTWVWEQNGFPKPHSASHIVRTIDQGLRHFQTSRNSVGNLAERRQNGISASGNRIDRRGGDQHQQSKVFRSRPGSTQGAHSIQNTSHMSPERGRSNAMVSTNTREHGSGVIFHGRRRHM